MKIGLVSSGFDPRRLRLQPHRTLLEMARQTAARDHSVVIISDQAACLPPREHRGDISIQLRRVPSVRDVRGRPNRALLETLDAESPHLLLWHVSFSSLLYQDLKHPLSTKRVGILTSPVHSLRDILRLGLRKATWDPGMVAIHLLGLFLPSVLVRRAFSNGSLLGMITLSRRTRSYLLQKGAPPDRVWVIPPGVDMDWLTADISQRERRALRRRLSFVDDDYVVTYFGGPSPLRGLHTLLGAAQRLARMCPRLKLLVLSRRRANEQRREAAYLKELVDNDNGCLKRRVHLVDGFLGQRQLIQHVHAGDAVCLPFELVPSDVPLSILEGMSLGQCVISTPLASIPELVTATRGFLVPPGAAGALASRIEMLVGTPDVARARGQAAREYVAANRTWNRMGEALDCVLKLVQES
jgi:glycosyltransferase involved in cell wall biosynthesis